jgi:hypothetical protein
MLSDVREWMSAAASQLDPECVAEVATILAELASGLARQTAEIAIPSRWSGQERRPG